MQLPTGNDCAIYTIGVMYDVVTWSGTGQCVRNVPPAREAEAARHWVLFILLRGGFGEETKDICNARMMTGVWEEEDADPMILNQDPTTENRGPEGIPRDRND